MTPDPPAGPRGPDLGGFVLAVVIGAIGLAVIEYGARMLEWLGRVW